MSKPVTQSDAKAPRISLPFAALLVLVFATWGGQQVAIKIGNGEIAPIFQAGLRSIGATFLLMIWFLWRGERPWRSGVPWHLVLALGLLFTLDFGLLFLGLAQTSASRGSILYYSAPFFIALGAHVFLRGDRLRLMGLLGFTVAFAGVGLVLASRDPAPLSGRLAGDLLCLAGAVAWAATILFIKASALSQASAAVTLFYQLAVSAVLLPAWSWAVGETWRVPLEPASIAALGYQIVIVAFAGYLLYFWLLKRHAASELSAYSFLTPVFGVLAGIVLLEEPVTLGFGLGALLVVTGIAIVNWVKA